MEVRVIVTFGGVKSTMNYGRWDSKKEQSELAVLYMRSKLAESGFICDGGCNCP